jgi:hypothetical protein
VELNKRDKDLVELVKGRFTFADGRIHQKFRTRCDEQYALYNNWDSLKRNLGMAGSASDRERILGDGQNMFGASMFIPFIYSTIETIVPRMAANAPTPRFRSCGPQYDAATRRMQLLVQAQLPKMKYGLSIQDTAKHGLFHGIGIRKNTWVKNVRQTKKLVEVDGSWGEMPINKTLYDDPMSGDVDPRDFIWDPFGSSMQTIEWAIHRLWRSNDFVKAKFEAGDWVLPEGVTIEDVQNRHGDQEYAKTHEGRAQAHGSRDSMTQQSGKIHEVWEYHDGDRIIVMLDREIPVSTRPNPHWHGEIPFTIYRPVSLPGEFVGRSVVDALEDLQIELNTLRAQRRDGASQELESPYAYKIGSVDPANLRWGRGFAIPVDGNPDDAFKQLRVNPVSGSSYQEENGLKDDIQRTAGVLDMAGGSSTTETATGAQLVYNEANQRIANMVKRLEEETITDDFGFFIQMNQQHIRTRAIQQPVPAPPPAPGEPDARWTWKEFTAEDLSGDMLPGVESGSIAADNTPQMRNDVQMWAQMFMNPYVDKIKVTEKMLECLGVNDPTSYMSNEQMIPAGVPGQMGAALEAQNVDPAMVQQAHDEAMAPHDGSMQDQQAQAPAGVA